MGKNNRLIDKSFKFFTKNKGFHPVSGLIVLIAAIVTIMGPCQRRSKVTIQNSDLRNSPTIVDSPGTTLSIEKVDETIYSSKIDVYLRILVDQELKEFNGTISSRRDTCFLKTKSGEELKFVSTAGTTRMARSGKRYEFKYVAELPPGGNVYRATPEEFLEATEVIIPLSPFHHLIEKRLVTESSYYTLEVIEGNFYANGNRIAQYKSSRNTDIGLESRISVPLVTLKK